MGRKKSSVAGNITAVIALIIVITVAVLLYINDRDSSYKVCTVSSVKLVSISPGGAPTSYVDARTEECGLLSVSNMSMPEGMNKAGLAEFLEANIGKKFEFQVGGLSMMGNNAYSSEGITSTTPVE
ncbi:hypothetical protein A7979_08400 [Rothia nasimurium]|uniref:Uncharacterized protein n=1 Tax=Rothia nasimurium TaxID=85336 RepID=A0A1Y1RMN4_9MICC|nr:hypothetical protein [Rothia nasimurium]ORC15208.1 hypothetical protein A7979_08400 [Rothia nasimurium]